MISIANTDSDIMYEGLYQYLLSKPSITGIEEIHLTHNSGKWLIVTPKKNKDQAQLDIDSFISNDEISTSIEHVLCRISKMNTHADFISYASILQRGTHKYDESMTSPPHSSQKLPVTIPYDLTDEPPPTSKKIRGKTISIPKDSDPQTTEGTDFSSISSL